MGTRVLIIIILKGKIITLYNHFDSYPTGLGFNLVEELIALLKVYTLDELIVILSNIKIVSDEIPPTNEEIELLKKYADPRVSSKFLTEWYCLLRECQGSIAKIIESGYALATEHESMDSAYEEADNRWAEFTYTIDFDNNNFDGVDGANTITGLCMESIEKAYRRPCDD